ncbi:hypothetical protein Tco_0844036 [Tanacetum coccineum]
MIWRGTSLSLSEIQLVHEKEDEFVIVVVNVVHECRDCMMVVKEIESRLLEEVEKLEWWFKQGIDDEEEENEEGEGGSKEEHKRCCSSKGVVPRRGEVGSFEDVLDGAFGGVGDEEVVVGEGVVVTSSSLEMLNTIVLEMMMRVRMVGLKAEEEDGSKKWSGDLFPCPIPSSLFALVERARGFMTTIRTKDTRLIAQFLICIHVEFKSYALIT